MFVARRSRGRSKGNNAVIEGRFFHVCDLRDGRLWRCREYIERAEALTGCEAR